MGEETCVENVCIFPLLFSKSMDFRDNVHSVKTEARRWKYSILGDRAETYITRFRPIPGLCHLCEKRMERRNGSTNGLKYHQKSTKRRVFTKFCKIRFHQLWVVGARLSSARDTLKGANLPFFGLVGGQWPLNLHYSA